MLEINHRSCSVKRGVKFWRKSHVLRTKNACLFEKNCLNTSLKTTRKFNIISQSNKNKRFIDRVNQSDSCITSN